MRETRLSGSEGGGTELNRSFLPPIRISPIGAHGDFLKTTSRTG